jgi:hypothetical protein
VEGFIDRLAELFKTLFGSESGNSPHDGSASPGSRSPGSGSGMGSPHGFVDPDLQAAWEELDEYIRTGPNSNKSSGGWRRGAGETRDGTRAGAPRPPDESLRQDYSNLEVAFGADIEVVRASYKRLMLKYHPDKHAGDLEKQKIALEIAKKINQSFERIRDRQEGRE